MADDGFVPDGRGPQGEALSADFTPDTDGQQADPRYPLGERPKLGDAQDVVNILEKYLMKPLNTASNMAATGAADVAHRAIGKGPLPIEDIHEPKDLGFLLEKRFGVNPIGAQLAGFIAQSKIDPTNYFGNMMGAFRRAKDSARGLNLNPSAILESLGKASYLSPFLRVTSDIGRKYKSDVSKATDFAEDLWNKGNPEVGGFGKSNLEIGEQLTNRRKEAWKPIEAKLKEAGQKAGQIDLAPTIGKALEAKRMEAAKKLALNSDLSLSDAMDKTPDGWSLLMRDLASESREAQEQALALLKKEVPDLADEIGKIGANLANAPDVPATLSVFKQLFRDLRRGPRSLDELQALKVSYANQAARNQQMGSNMFARNSLPNVQKTADMQASIGLSDKLDDVVETTLGKVGGDQLKEAKRIYSARRRGELPAWAEIGKAEARQPMSKLDWIMALGGGAAAAQHQGALLPYLGLMAAKGLHEVGRSPRLGTGAGMLLNNASKLNIWDDMLRRGILSRQGVYTNED